MPGTNVLPLVLPVSGDDPRQLGAGEVLDGSAKVIDLLPLQSGGLVSGLLGVESAINGSDFIWRKDYLPANRSVYLETFASGSALTTQVVTTLYTQAGVAAGATTTTNTTTGALVQSTTLTLVDGATYQLRFKAALLGTGTLKLARLIIL